MANQQWLLYGASGYTGQLIIEEALSRGHRPILAGRNAAKIKKLATKYQLPCEIVSLENKDALLSVVSSVDLVFHAAGPYTFTAEPMMQACLAGKTHYIDITGEADVFKRCFALSEEAVNRGIALVSGVGFDVLPTDCLASYVAHKIENPDTLEVAIFAKTRPTPGTAKSMLETIRHGTSDIRENGLITQRPLGSIVKRVQFPSTVRSIALSPIADVHTAYFSTGARNIRSYIALPEVIAQTSKYVMPTLTSILSKQWIAEKVETLIDQYVEGPKESYREVGRAEVWAAASNSMGAQAEACLSTGEIYKLTAHASVRFLENLLSQNVSGAFAPAQLFPMEQLLEIDDINLHEGNKNSPD